MEIYIYSFIDMNSNHYHFKQFHESYIVLYIPSGKHNKKLWKITIFNGKTHYKWPCSIILLYVCQRVCVYTSIYIVIVCEAFGIIFCEHHVASDDLMIRPWSLCIFCHVRNVQNLCSSMKNWLVNGDSPIGLLQSSINWVV
jgi:hypothetical protein